MHMQPSKSNGTSEVALSEPTRRASLPCDGCASRSLGVCAPLDRKGLASLAAMGGQRHWTKGQVLYYSDDAAQAFYKITRGIVAESLMLADGRRQIVAILTVGDLCGYPARNGRHMLTGHAVTPVEACAFGAEKFHAYVGRNAQLASAVADEVAERLEEAILGRAVVGQLRSRERVAYFILEMEERLRSRGLHAAGPIGLRLTREEIADYLGLTLETVSRAFTDLKHMRLISLDRADTVVVLDRKRLSDVAGKVLGGQGIAKRWPRGESFRHAMKNAASATPEAEQEARQTPLTFNADTRISPRMFGVTAEGETHVEEVPRRVGSRDAAGGLPTATTGGQRAPCGAAAAGLHRVL
jgi:CRP/FNR family transcriptional regulator, anaerobic regulatory protein